MVALAGETLAVVTVPADSIRAVGDKEVAHAGCVIRSREISWTRARMNLCRGSPERFQPIAMIWLSVSQAWAKDSSGTLFNGCGFALRARQSNDFG